ncbi:MAG: hypothetical protein U0M02_07790 [Acutalibacteraceae bacterium]|nr:hypothetical protein [Acutalibacteraceae bacterium]
MEKMLQIIRDTVRKISVKTKLSVKMLGAVLLLVTGAAVLIFSECSEKKNVVAQAETTQSETDVSEYTAKLEERLVSIISAIDGAGETKVMVTLESGSEEIYLSNFDYGENSDSNGKNSYERKDEFVIIDGSSGQEGIVIRTAEPKVRGVAVVCAGAGSDTVCAEIVEAVTALLDISSARVSVAKMN